MRPVWPWCARQPESRWKCFRVRGSLRYELRLRSFWQDTWHFAAMCPQPLEARLKGFLTQATSAIAGLGGLGLFLFAALDSSFLFLPFGFDLLLIGMSAGEEGKMVYFAMMATAGSVAGTALFYRVAKKGGEKGLKRLGSKDRIGLVRRCFDTRAGWFLAGAAAMPPPFPYRLFVAAAAVFKYPLGRLLLIVAAVRFLRYLAECLLGASLGTRLTAIVQSDGFFYSVLAITLISVVASAVPLYQRYRSSESA